MLTAEEVRKRLMEVEETLLLERGPFPCLFSHGAKPMCITNVRLNGLAEDDDSVCPSCKAAIKLESVLTNLAMAMKMKRGMNP